MCQAELHVPPEAASQERQLQLAQLKPVMDTVQTIQEIISLVI